MFDSVWGRGACRKPRSPTHQILFLCALTTSVQVLKHPQMTWKVSLWESQVSIWVLGDFHYKVPMGPLAVAAVPSEFCGATPSWTCSFVFGRPLWQSQRWASFVTTRGTETHQESVPLLGEAAVCFWDTVSDFQMGYHLGSLFQFTGLDLQLGCFSRGQLDV